MTATEKDPLLSSPDELERNRVSKDPAAADQPRYVLAKRNPTASRVFFAIVLGVLCVHMLFRWHPTVVADMRDRVFKSSDVDAASYSTSKDLIQVKTLKGEYIPGHKKHGKHGRRLVIVGDVHGCKKDLVSLLDKMDFKVSHDHLILAGDMIEKGPDSHGVISLARSLDASCVRGNHEDNVLRRPSSDPASASALGLSNADVRFLRACPVILFLGGVPGLPFGNVAVVHAGLVPHVPLERQDAQDAMHMRTMSVSTDHKTPRFTPSAGRTDGEPWWAVWRREQETLPQNNRTLVVYGHDSRSGLNEQRYSIGLDSGCRRGGRLSALVIEGRGAGQTSMKVKSVKCHAK